MSTISNELVKDLRMAFAVWQQDYDPVEDKEQYDMFGLGVVAMDELLALRKEREKAEPVADDDSEIKWRELALQFDGHRMQAICFLKQILKELPEAEFSSARDFLKSGPLSGEEVLRNRIAALAQPATIAHDERYQQLSELYHAQEKRLFKLAQRIKGQTFDKYAHSPSQAIDVLEAAVFGETHEDGHAAMLQSGNDDIGSWSNHKNTPTDKPKSEMSQQAEQLLRDTTELAETLGAETDTTAQQFESLAFKSVVPEGWKLVPIELTKEMRREMHPFAEATCLGCGRQVVADCVDNVTASWNDMLAVAPEPCK
ncbi:hypothetical protein ACI072_001881 [Cronobacter sakazakii]